jgi:DNA modification methylase
MNSQESERLLSVLDQHAHEDQAGHIKPFGFYWTRKNYRLAARIISEFSESKSVVLDPFLGSGSTALGAFILNGERLFIGVEINQLPIENLKLNLGVEQYVTDEQIEGIFSALDSIRGSYILESSDGPMEIHKTIHNLEAGELTPIKFELSDSQGKRKSLTLENENFNEIKKLYLERIRSFGTVEKSPKLEANSRIAVKDGMSASDIFGPIGYHALLRLRKESSDSILFRLIIGSCLHLCRLTDAKSQSQFPFWYPKQDIHEKSIYDVVHKKLLEFVKAIPKLNEFNTEVTDVFRPETERSTNLAMLITGSAVNSMQNMIPMDSVDLVLTDPPYFDQVAYSEYLKIWEFFTGFNSNLEEEIVESSRVNAGKTRAKYLESLQNAFKDVKRVMKPGALAFVYFKDSKPRNVHDFIYSLESAGLKYEFQVHLPKASYTYKQNSSQENTVGGDSIMVFRALENYECENPTSTLTLEELDKVFLEKFSTYISDHGPSSLTEALDSRLIGEMYKLGYLEKIKSSSHFSKIVSENYVYDSDTRKWHTS